MTDRPVISPEPRRNFRRGFVCATMASVTSDRRIYFSEHYSAIGMAEVAGEAFHADLHPVEEMPDGCILVLPTASPSYLPYLEHAKAIVCEEGGMLCHLAIVCREIGLPFIRIKGATDLLPDGEWVELAPEPLGDIALAKSPAESESPDAWFMLSLMKPWPPPQEEIDRNLGIIRVLPRLLIGKDYELAAEVRDGGIWISRKAVDGFIADIKGSLDVLSSKLEGYDSMTPYQKLSVSKLTMVLSKELLPMMEEFAGDRDLALDLMRCGQAYYLELDGSFSGSVAHFIPSGSMVTPQSLKARVPSEELDLSKAKDPQKSEKLAKIFRLLICAYEDKDRPWGGRPDSLLE